MPRIVPVLPTLTVAVLLTVLCSLGFWQLDRMRQKEAMLARYHANSLAAPAPLPRQIADPQSYAFRAVQLDCAFEGPAHLSPGSSPDGRAGQHVYALCREEGRAARVVVDLGWVPFQADVPLIAGLRARIEGIARPWTEHTFVETLSGSARVSPQTFQSGGEADSPIAPVFVQARTIAPLEGASLPGIQPSPLQVEAIPNNHRSYAIQWFAFATILLIIYGVYLARWRRLQAAGANDTVRRS